MESKIKELKMSTFKEYLEEVKTKKEKVYKIENERSGGFMSNRPSRYSYQTGTLKELISAYGYTLEKGASWQHEKGNKKVNRNPTSIKSLVDNLNKATNNSASNGYSGDYYKEVPLDYQEKK